MTPHKKTLTAYVDDILTRLRERGYTIVYASDLRATRDADLCLGNNPARALARAEWATANTDESHRATLNSVAYDFNGFISWPQKHHTGLCVLPDHDGAARRFAASHHLDYGRLRAAGVTDTDVYGIIAVHEVSHALGNNGEDEEGPTSCEYSTYALHTARLLRAGMKPVKLMLVNHALALHSFMAALRNPVEKFTYDRIMSAATWALQNADDPTVWDESADAFTPAAYAHIRAQAARIARDENAVLHESLRALHRSRLLLGKKLDETQPGFAALFCRAAQAASDRLRTQGDITPDGPDHKLQAALMLRQAARGFTTLQAFAP